MPINTTQSFFVVHIDRLISFQPLTRMESGGTFEVAEANEIPGSGHNVTAQEVILFEKWE